jgi:hypothetical protein
VRLVRDPLHFLGKQAKVHFGIVLLRDPDPAMAQQVADDSHRYIASQQDRTGKGLPGNLVGLILSAFGGLRVLVAAPGFSPTAEVWASGLLSYAPCCAKSFRPVTLAGEKHQQGLAHK